MRVLKKILKLIFCISIIGFIAIGLGLTIWTKYPEFKARKEISDLDKNARKISDIKIGEKAKIIALGEASHGNKEFQKLKLDVFKNLVENNDVRAFALECDFSEGILIDKYIKNPNIKVNPLEYFSFSIYKTEEMKNLIEWMKEYNKIHNEKLSFYGFDMQNPEKLIPTIKDYVGKNRIEFALDKLKVLETYPIKVKDSKVKDLIENLKVLKDKIKEESDDDIIFKKAIDNFLEGFSYYSLDDNFKEYETRDRLMAENVIWISKFEDNRNSKLMIAGHNGHIGKTSNIYKIMGDHLSEFFKDKYFTIGTDFYKTRVNISSMTDKKRVIKKFISADPIAQKAEKYDGIFYLDFNNLQNGATKSIVESKMKMGSLGEGYFPMMNVIAKTYRIDQVPKDLYDSMIFIYEANPTEIIN
ncbi:erythromycin esterase family protein [Anaerococcus sp. AGMB00486]|uniref:Erythromycin esterase family protein n=2 Tax=Anaerococcus TaxID=165779 RepID=A0ABX2NA30_9FIRM|nr:MULTISPECIES: erythromycin esterase family protein [Anaerococcus]MDY3006722.1 erythromycin esterase family protein [Anaerococcus porci]MSS77711.1 erythromycin esterase family protein [Anaerococcus porci]NVF11567.1 erythromycin esterase family protein [Anaerococcus faecalis]